MGLRTQPGCNGIDASGYVFGMTTAHGTGGTGPEAWCGCCHSGGNAGCGYRHRPSRLSFGHRCSRPVVSRHRAGLRSSPDRRCQPASRGSTAATPGSTNSAWNGATVRSTGPCENLVARRVAGIAEGMSLLAVARCVTCRLHGPSSGTSHESGPCSKSVRC